MCPYLSREVLAFSPRATLRLHLALAFSCKSHSWVPQYVARRTWRWQRRRVYTTAQQRRHRHHRMRELCREFCTRNIAYLSQGEKIAFLLVTDSFGEAPQSCPPQAARVTQGLEPCWTPAPLRGGRRAAVDTGKSLQGGLVVVLHRRGGINEPKLQLAGRAGCEARHRRRWIRFHSHRHRILYRAS